MNKYFRISLWVFIFCPLLVRTQVHVRLVAAQLPAGHGSDTLYAAGNFNIWKTHDDKYKFAVNNNGERILELNVPAGKYEFKITRGDWSRMETTAEGKNLGNRAFVVTEDTTIKLVIAGWSDDFKKESFLRKHTASPNVTIMDSAFTMPQLNRTRRITLYLPKDYYTNTKKKFGVLYMHDGQNLFDEATSGFGEWGIDECLDSLFMQGEKECIVVGIDNGPKRMNEYNPYNFTSFGNGEGKGYVDFIVSTLKPFIDTHLRTLKGKRNTFIAGSSMGGLISMYAVLKYPGTFGGAPAGLW